MRSCPNCKLEYTDNNEKCPWCGYKNEYIRPDTGKDWIRLTTAANDIESELIVGLLKTCNIPAVVRTIGVDRIVGAPIAGIEVLVPEEKYDEALQILNSQVDEDILTEEEIKTGEEENEE